MNADATVAELLATIRQLPSDDPVIDPKKWYRTQPQQRCPTHVAAAGGTAGAACSLDQSIEPVDA